MATVADWIFQNGQVRTLDPSRPVARALAVARGRVAATGSAADMRALRGRATRVVDLQGATVVPGLVDAHAHLDREGLKTIHPSLARCRSIGDIQVIVRGVAARMPKGQWVARSASHARRPSPR